LGAGGRELLAKRIEFGLTADHGEIRWLLASLTVDISQQFPLFGVGFGVWAAVAPRFADPSLAAFSLDYAHNDPLQFVAETGVFGLVILVISVFYLSKVTILALKALPTHAQRVQLMGTSLAIVVPVLHSFLDFPLHIPALAVLLAVTLATHLRLIAVALVPEEIDS
jgi:O-antigen ligase